MEIQPTVFETVYHRPVLEELVHSYNNTTMLQPHCFREKIILVGSKSLCVAHPIYSQETLKYSNSSMTPLNENFTSALNHPMHNFSCKSLCNITLALAEQYILYNYRTNGYVALYSSLAIQIHKTLLQYPCMTSLEQSIPDLSSALSIQMSIKIHLLYWGIPVKHHITVKVSNHLNHTDFSKNIQLCASCQIISSRTVLSLWKLVPTVLAGLMVRPDCNCG